MKNDRWQVIVFKLVKPQAQPSVIPVTETVHFRTEHGAGARHDHLR